VTQGSKPRALPMMAMIAFAMATPAWAQAGGSPDPVLSPTAKPSGPVRSPSMTTSLPGTTSNPKSSTIASKPKLVPNLLTVRYLVDPAYPVTLTAAGLTFGCAPEPNSPTPMIACAAQANAGHVDLSASYGKGSPLAPILPKVSGGQWKGACAGTSGDTCSLTMNGPQSVGIDFYAKP